MFYRITQENRKACLSTGMESSKVRIKRSKNNNYSSISNLEKNAYEEKKQLKVTVT